MKKLAMLLLLISSSSFAQLQQPKLIIQIVIDQLRGDLLSQYSDRFGKDGFNYLRAHGIDYHNAHHPQANTVTCVGHATISTGTWPAYHGIVANDWYDRKAGQETYCVEDLKSPILPTVRTKIPLEGRSPQLIMASTLSDEIVLAQKGRAFGVSLKDRSAITLAGHAGKAFWFDKSNGGFVTSSHYYTNYPLWVNDWNKHYEAKNETWNLSQPITSYRYAKAPRFNNRFPDFGRDFPHQLGAPDKEQFYKYLSMTPFADEITAKFAIDLINNEQLGQRKDKTDYLGISFSGVDAIGHQFGPNSIESEDNLLRLDKTIANLLHAIDQSVGLANTVIVVSADHGVSDAEVYSSKYHITARKPLNRQALKKTIEDTLAKKYQLSSQSLTAIDPPYIYLNHQLIHDKNLSVKDVSRYLAEVLSDDPMIYKAYPLPTTKMEKSWLAAKVNTMDYPERAGDLYLVPPPYQTLDDISVKTSHGTPWVYDSYVPVLFVNPGFKAAFISRPVSTIDIAPTLASLLKIKFPSATVGKPLPEVLKQFT